MVQCRVALAALLLSLTGASSVLAQGFSAPGQAPMPAAPAAQPSTAEQLFPGPAGGQGLGAPQPAPMMTQQPGVGTSLLPPVMPNFGAPQPSPMLTQQPGVGTPQPAPMLTQQPGLGVPQAPPAMTRQPGFGVPPGPGIGFGSAPAQPMQPARPNYAQELTDFGVQPQTTLQTKVASDTPLTIPGGHVITTNEMRQAVGSNIVFIDVWQAPAHPTIPGAIELPGAGSPGSFNDAIQRRLWPILAQLTNREAQRPIVFFCTGAHCWESYNAALRAINMGFKLVLWLPRRPGGMAGGRPGDRLPASASSSRNARTTRRRRRHPLTELLCHSVGRRSSVAMASCICSPARSIASHSRRIRRRVA